MQQLISLEIDAQAAAVVHQATCFGRLAQAKQGAWINNSG